MMSSLSGKLNICCVDFVWSFFARHAGYVQKLEDNLADVKSTLEDLTAMKRQVIRRVLLVEEQRKMKRLEEVNLWFARVDIAVAEGDELIKSGDRELQRLCLGGYLSMSCCSTSMFGKKVEKCLNGLRALKNTGTQFGAVAEEAPGLEFMAELPCDTTVGLESKFNEVWSCLVDKNVGIVGLYGIGGVGKTTLLTQIRNKLVDTCNDSHVIWVVVGKDSRHDDEMIQEEIGKRIGFSAERWGSREVAEKMFNRLRNEKFILFLDDIWEPIELAKIGVPPREKLNGSKILFTTRSLRVCGEMLAQRKIRVETLEWKHAWELFVKYAGEDTINVNPQIPPLAQSVAKKCGGLPIALIATARAMSCKMDPRDWKQALEVIKEPILHLEGLEEEIMENSSTVITGSMPPPMVASASLALTSPNKPNLSSYVWDEMERVMMDGLCKAKCKWCHQLIIDVSSDSSTSYMLHHLNSCKKRRVQDKNQSHNFTQTNIDDEEGRRALSIFIACEHQSFLMVENPAFRHFMSINCPEFKNISRHTTRRDLLTYYTREKDCVKDELAKAPGRVCLSSVNWSSKHTDDDCICVTAHWVGEDWKLHKKMIRSKALTPLINGETIADEIALCLTQWRIKGKVMSITLDDASYNDPMARELKTRLIGLNSLMSGGKFFQIHCCSHVLNLIVQSSLQLIVDEVAKIRGGIKYFKKPVTRRKKFYKHVEKTFHLDAKKKLRCDVRTRWNSTYLMLDHTLYYKNVWMYWASKDENFKFALSPEEWEKIKTLHKFLKVFYEVTCIFFETKHPTSNIYFRGLFKIHILMLEVLRSPENFMTTMVSTMYEKFKKYWDDFHLLLSCAAVLDPRFKLAYVTYCFEKIYGEMASEYVNDVMNTLTSLLHEYKGRSVVESSVETLSGSNFVANGNVMDGDEDEEFDLYRSRRSNGIFGVSELDSYLREEDESKTYNLKSEIDVLEYWSKNSDRYPYLTLMARDLLSIPISAIASELAFGVGEKIVNHKQGSLNSKAVQALICYEDWLRAKGFLRGESNLLTIGGCLEYESSSSDSDDDEDEDGCDISFG